MTHVMMQNARELKVPWRNRVITFDAWADNDFGLFDYTTQNSKLVVDFELRPTNRGSVAVVIHRLNGETPSITPTATLLLDGEYQLSTVPDQVPQTVPDALFATMIWAEWIAERWGA